MSDFVRIASRSELPRPGDAAEFTVGDKTICIANVNGVFAAMDNVCLHRGGSLGQGNVDRGKVICPWHGWAWDPKTGATKEDPKLRVTIYELKFEGDDVMLKV